MPNCDSDSIRLNPWRAGEVLFRYNRVQGDLRGQAIMTTCRYTRLAVAFICIAIFVGGFIFGLAIDFKCSMR